MWDQLLTNACRSDAAAWESVIRELGTILKVSKRSACQPSVSLDPAGANDCEPLYSTYGDDPELADLVEMFVAEMPDRIRNLENLFQNANDEHLARAAHQMKGAVGSYGFHSIAPAAASLEAAVRAGAPCEVVRRALDQVILLCQRARAGRCPSDAEAS